METLFQFGQSISPEGTSVNDWVADVLVDLEKLLRLTGIGKIYLVHADYGWDFIHLRHNQKSIQFANAWSGSANGEDE